MAGSCLKTHSLLKKTCGKTVLSSARSYHEMVSSDFSLPLKVLSFGNHRQPLSHDPYSSACSPLLSSSRLLPGTYCWAGTAIGHVASRTKRSHECTSQWICHIDKRVPLLSLGYILVSVCDRPDAFSDCPINFPNFLTLCGGPPPDQSLLFPCETDRPLQFRTACCRYSVFHSAHAYLLPSPGLIPNRGLEGEGGLSTYPIILLALYILSAILPLLTILPGGRGICH